MPITRKGWELHIERFTVQKSGALSRTLGRYQVYIKGVPQPGLSGFICERPGPGDNTKKGIANKRRIAAGRYPLSTQFGQYRSIRYTQDTTTPGKLPMPGFLIGDTGARTAILVHPGHPPSLYLSSVGCLNPTAQVGPKDVMNYWESRQRVIDLIGSLARFAPQAFKHEVNTAIADAFVVVDGEPMKEAPAAVEGLEMPVFAAAAGVEMPLSLPVSEAAARKCAAWLWQNFESELTAAVKGKPYDVSHLAAIVCQETAYKWLPWIGKLSVKTIVERAVYDASGDDPKHPRHVFPVDTAAFQARFGKAFTNMLIDEANKTRALQKWKPLRWVYKGYGLFQYDLQAVLEDREFFEQRQWYDFTTCVRKCTAELDRKLVIAKGDLWKAIKAYNGSGSSAQEYMENVRYYQPICAEVVGAAAVEAIAIPASKRGRKKPARRSVPAAAIESTAGRALSGAEWVDRFPDSGKVDDLEPAFRAACVAFIAALRKAGATVTINSTRRPRERAYLMNGAWRIAKESEDPSSIEPMDGVDIAWVHRKGDGTADLTASRRAARAMVAAYGIAYKPSMKSNHILGKAIDMNISWSGPLKIVNGKGTLVTITGAPRTGLNQTLWPVGSSYGVKKLDGDDPHWSANGH